MRSSFESRQIKEIMTMQRGTEERWGGKKNGWDSFTTELQKKRKSCQAARGHVPWRCHMATHTLTSIITNTHPHEQHCPLNRCLHADTNTNVWSGICAYDHNQIRRLSCQFRVSWCGWKNVSAHHHPSPPLTRTHTHLAPLSKGNHYKSSRKPITCVCVCLLMKLKVMNELEIRKLIESKKRELTYIESVCGCFFWGGGVREGGEHLIYRTAPTLHSLTWD